MASRIELLNRALMRIGAQPLIDELDPVAPPHIAVYDSVLSRLAAYPWSFMKTSRRLVRRDAAPDPAHFPAHWKYAFDLPPDHLGALRAVYDSETLRRPFLGFEVQGAVLLTDAAQIWVVVMVTSQTQRWPGDFSELLMTAVMAELALSIREDRPLHDRLYAKAFGSPGQNGMGGLLAAALENDAQGVPDEAIGDGSSPLIDARF